MIVKVEGANKFTELARRLKTYGDGKTLRAEFYKGINRAAKPLKDDVRKAARERLPHRGGLAQRVASSRITVTRRMTGNAAGVSIKGTNGYDIGSIDRGRVRHLVYGHKPWVNQMVKSGFWTDPLEAGAPAVREELEKVMEDVANKIAD